MDLYKVREEDVFRFANQFHCKHFRRGAELVFDICPYCNSQEDKQTFSINLHTGQFQCKRASCNAKGNMLTLSRDFSFTLNDEVDRYLALNTYANKFIKFENRPIEVRSPAIAYMNKRGISKEVVERFKVTNKEFEVNILCFPFFDEEGQLTFIKYRNEEFVKGFTPGSKEWCEKNCKPILFGMNLITEFNELVITEGQIDSMSVVEAGYNNAVSVPTGCNGFTWLPHCWEWLQKFQTIIIFGDCEKGQVTLYDYLHTRIGNKVKCVAVEDYQGYKDANDILVNCGAEYVLKAIENARNQVSARLKPMSKVKSVDPSKLHTISTGIDEIDKFLGGGFKAGQVILQTGERGNGKSTFASQCVCEALQQGNNCLMYSGELPEFYVKNWIDRQLLGKEQPTQTEIDSVNKWYDDRLFLYDNDIKEENVTEEEAIAKTIEEAIALKDCRFILIDNLMTIVSESDNESLYRVQSNFVGELCRIAKKYSVVIMLIAHPRKRMQSNGDFRNDDVSGSADITNRVDIVMSYDRIYEHGEETDPTSRQMSITKNRLFGFTTTKNSRIVLYFDNASKRIANIHKVFDKVYVEDKEGYASAIPDSMEVPF